MCLLGLRAVSGALGIVLHHCVYKSQVCEVCQYLQSYWSTAVRERGGWGRVSYRVRIIMCLAVYITMILILVCIADSVHSSGGSGFNDIHDGFIGSLVTNAHVCTADRGQCSI